MDISHIIFVILFGSLIGFITGLLGGGGSILAIIGLTYIFHESLSVTVSTSLAIVGTSAFIGVLLHSYTKTVRFKTGLVIGLASVAGAYPGALLHHLVTDKIVLLLFGFLIIIVGIDMLHYKDSRKQSISTSETLEVPVWRHWFVLVLIGAAVGFIAGFFGVSGGFLMVPALVIILHLSPRQAVGTSLLVMTLTSISAFLSHLHFGTIDYELIGLCVAGAVIGVLSGSILSERIPDRQLTKILGIFIIIIAAYTIYKNI